MSLSCRTQSATWSYDFGYQLFFLPPGLVFLTQLIKINTDPENTVSEFFSQGTQVSNTVAVDLPIKCHVICSQDVRRQSYNAIIGRHICELNNRTKEARPDHEDFVQDFKRFYMRHSFNSGIKLFSKISRIVHEIPYSINSLVKQFATLT